MQKYPTFRLPVIQQLLELRQSYDQSNSILNDSTCPYDGDMIAALKELFRLPFVAEAVPTAMTLSTETEQKTVGRPRGELALAKMRADSREIASEELRRVQEELKLLREEAKGLQPNDRIAIIKTAVAMVEKLIVLEERNYNLKRAARFQQVIISLLDDLMPVDNRAEFMTRLANFEESD